MSRLGKKLIQAAKEGVEIAKRSAIHRDLRTPKYAKRVVQSKKVYSRRAKAQQAEEAVVSDVQALEDGLADALEDERARQARRR